MKLTYILFILLLSACAINVTAQDIIKLKDSTELTVRIVAVTPTKIIYKEMDTLADYHLTLNRTRIERINYANGVIEIVDNDPHFYRHLRSAALVYRNMRYGKNIIAVAPLQVNEESQGNHGNPFLPGIGLDYEHIFSNHHGLLSFYLPLTLSFYTIYNESFNYNNNPFGNIVYPTKQGTHTFFTMYPGIKIYPWGSSHRVTYNLGTSVSIGFGRKYNSTLNYTTIGTINYMGEHIDSVSAVTVNESKPVFKAGLMFTNGINIMAAKKVYIGLEAGAGFYFTDNEYIYDTNKTYGARVKGGGIPLDLSGAMFEANCKVGYRF